jgi:micrococcal nuclease
VSELLADLFRGQNAIDATAVAVPTLRVLVRRRGVRMVPAKAMTFGPLFHAAHRAYRRAALRNLVTEKPWFPQCCSWMATALRSSIHAPIVNAQLVASQGKFGCLHGIHRRDPRLLAQLRLYHGHPSAGADEIAAAEQEAKAAGRGLWGPPYFGQMTSVPI